MSLFIAMSRQIIWVKDWLALFSTCSVMSVGLFRLCCASNSGLKPAFVYISSSCFLAFCECKACSGQNSSLEKRGNIYLYSRPIQELYPFVLYIRLAFGYTTNPPKRQLFMPLFYSICRFHAGHQKESRYGYPSSRTSLGIRDRCFTE